MAYDLSQLLERLPKDPEFEAAQARDTNRGNWQRVSDDLYSAFSRQPYEETKLPSEAAQLSARRDSGMKQLTGAAQLDDIAGKLDPESIGAKLYRPVVKSQYGKLGMDVPPELDQANAGDLAGASGMIDKVENASKTKGGVAMDEVMRKALVAKGKKLEASLGVKDEDMEDWDHYPAAKLIDMIRLREGEASRAGTDKRAGENHGVQVAKLAQGTERVGIAKEKLAMSQLHAAQEAQKTVSAKFVANDPVRKPFTAADTEAFAKQQASVDTMKATLAEATDILDRNGGAILPTSPDAKIFEAAMARALGNIVGAEGLGTMTDAHQHLAASLHTDPTSLWSWSQKVMGREGVTREQIQALVTDAERSVDNVVANHGGRRRQAGEKVEVSPYAPRPGIEQAKANAAKPDTVTPPPAPAIPEGTTKVVGGTTFVRRNGGWVPQ